MTMIYQIDISNYVYFSTYIYIYTYIHGIYIHIYIHIYIYRVCLHMYIDVWYYYAFQVVSGRSMRDDLDFWCTGISGGSRLDSRHATTQFNFPYAQTCKWLLILYSASCFSKKLTPRLLVLFGALIMLIHVDSIYSQVIRCLSKVIGAISLTFHTWACKTSWLLTVAKQHCGRCSYRVISHDLMCGIFGSWHFPQECSEMVRFSYCPFSTRLWPLHPFTVNQTSKTIGNGCSIWVITTGDKMNWD